MSTEKEKEYGLKYYYEHQEKYKQRQKEYYYKHKEEIKEKQKKYYDEHKKECKERQHKYYNCHKEEYKERQSKYLEFNKEKYYEYQKQNKEKFRKYNKEYREQHKEYRESKKSNCIYLFELQNNKMYVGSTNLISRRLAEHRLQFLEFPNRKLYKAISDNGGWNNVKIHILMDNIPDKDLRLILEQHFINMIPEELSLNSRNASII